MAIRVENSGDIILGIMVDGQVVATHGRFQKAGVAPVVRPLDADVTAEIGERLRIPSGSMDVVYPAGEANNDHMDAVVRPYWESETFQIDLMTSSTVIVADSGYTQATHDSWVITQEAD